MLRKYLGLSSRVNIAYAMSDNQLNFYIDGINKIFLSNVITRDRADRMIEIISNKHQDDIETLRIKSFTCFYLGDIDESLKISYYGLTLYPKFIRLYHDIISIYIYLKEYELAFKLIEEALKIDPKDESLLIAYASVNLKTQNITKAIDILNYVLSINDKNIKAIDELANIYYYVDTDKRVDMLKKAILVNQGNSDKYYTEIAFSLLTESREDHSYNLQRAYEWLLNVEDRGNNKQILFSGSGALLKFLDFDSYDKRFNGFNERLDFAINVQFLQLIYLMARVESIQDRINLKDVFKKWGESVSNKVSTQLDVSFTKNNSKKIRLGLWITRILDDHVCHFIRPIIELLDKTKFELYVYYFMSSGEKGYIYQIIKSKSDKLVGYRVNSSVKKIRNSVLSDQLDVLLETGIQFLYPELIVQKLAPVQISWLDCPQSNGLSSDYILTDPYINPGEEWLLEKPLILKNTWVAVDEKRFKPHDVTEEIPEDRNGYVTFGTMNSGFKFTREAFRVWAYIMHKVPNSRFLYVRPEVAAPALRANFYKRMDEYGISRDRISFFATKRDHMNQYHNIDIALDVFPHTGGTTTCEALWMGVPVVTLVGPCFFERLSYSNLMNSGLPDLCAFSIKEYQQKSIDLAFDVDRRRWLKKNLRNQILSSPLGNTKDFVKDLEDAISKIVVKST